MCEILWGHYEVLLLSGAVLVCGILWGHYEVLLLSGAVRMCGTLWRISVNWAWAQHGYDNILKVGTRVGTVWDIMENLCC